MKPPPDLKPLLGEIDEAEVAGNRPPLSVVIADEPHGNGHSVALVTRARTVAAARSAVRHDLRRAWDHWSATPLSREELSGERPHGVPQPPG